ncbi:MAG: T9SS type A sorting domain-containing protein [Bacteroidales bacterium]|nr:T9SS type A sorting domain-containing protein [Bacteroidales bacterium]
MRRIIFLLLATFVLPIYADSHLVIELKNSKSHTYSLKEKPVLKFENGEMTVENSDIYASYPITDILKYYFTEETTDIPPIGQEADNVRFIYTNKDYLLVEGADENSYLHVYDITGKSCPADITNEGGTIKISLSGLNKGIYLININGKHTFKIYR